MAKPYLSPAHIVGVVLALYFGFHGLHYLNDQWFLFRPLVTRWTVGVNAGGIVYEATTPDFGPSVSWDEIHAPIAVLQQSACDYHLPTLFGSIALVKTGDCGVGQQVKNLEKSGALAAIFPSDGSKDASLLESTATDIGIPSVFVNSSTFDALKSRNQAQVMRVSDDKTLAEDTLGLIGVFLVVAGTIVLFTIVIMEAYVSFASARASDKKRETYDRVAAEKRLYGNDETGRVWKH